MARELNSAWLKHLGSQDEQKKFEEQVRSSHRVLSRLSELIDEALDGIQIKETKEGTYKDPSWAFYQAHLNGKRASLLELRKLLDFLED